MKQKGLTTGQIAKRTGMFVRTLRYYDRIGLLKPSNYHGDTRLYSEMDIFKLQKLSVLKFIGFSLEEMKAILESEGTKTDLRSSLFLQKKLIRQKIKHMDSVVQAIEASIESMDRQEQEPNWEEMTDIIHTVRTDRDWSEQYHNALRLQSRIHLYDRFSTNSMGWHRWFFEHVLRQASQLSLPAPIKILDIGCGDAALWLRNIDRIPPHWEITLADASAGMLEDARTSLGKSAARFVFRQADVQALPFLDGEFQIIIANHMLYHVEDLPLASTEMNRVLYGNGTLFASTMSSRHLKEMEELAREFDPSLLVLDDTLERFNLYNGAELLVHWFPSAKLIHYPDSLVVTKAGPLISYMTSTPMNAGKRLTGEALEPFTAFVEQRMAEKGSLAFTKDMGFFCYEKKEANAI
ncbi:MerR family transcriptional regulator [Paenibacillus wynnii]|uniref:MerR family transcriptional regulator n=1 Tax=Paenibacillus wynnii TaxID=268407 RepID=A0A098MAJ2_9BACL|nr:MerR family transcriptional regulator [Paenibacillus wynnii]KGE19076.1 MerR family transcriptional regulator [Paenibacillus wynnii]